MTADDILISSWIVLDNEDDATAFPSTGSNSSSESFQLVYWRCILLYFATSRIHNPNNRHALFCNREVESVAPIEVIASLRNLNVDFVTFPILHRFPKGTVQMWGNQFYVIDIIEYFAKNELAPGFILADSDCIWRKPVSSFADDLFHKHCLLYTLMSQDQKDYEPGSLMNGMTHHRMRDVVETTFDQEMTHLPLYHGGEFFAADHAYCKDISSDFDRLWQLAVSEVGLADSIKEEAHFLSILAEARNIRSYTANHIIRRIWTHFKDLNVQECDMNLAIWHLPAEKRFGFARMYSWYVANVADWRSISCDEINGQSASYMGVPRRSTGKLILDVVQKVGEKLGEKIL